MNQTQGLILLLLCGALLLAGCQKNTPNITQQPNGSVESGRDSELSAEEGAAEESDQEQGRTREETGDSVERILRELQETDWIWTEADSIEVDILIWGRVDSLSADDFYEMQMEAVVREVYLPDDKMEQQVTATMRADGSDPTDRETFTGVLYANSDITYNEVSATEDGEESKESYAYATQGRDNQFPGLAIAGLGLEDYHFQHHRAEELADGRREYRLQGGAGDWRKSQELVFLLDDLADLVEDFTVNDLELRAVTNGERLETAELTLHLENEVGAGEVVVSWSVRSVNQLPSIAFPPGVPTSMEEWELVARES